jgi:iron complex transport system substrate-binding protein
LLRTVSVRVRDGEKVIEEMQKSIDEITAIGSKITDKKTVLFEISGSPSIYSVGKDTYIDEMISLIGAKNVMGDQESWISVTDEAAIAANPDVILTGSDQSQNPVGDIMSLPGWENVTAVKNQAVNYINNDSVMIPSEKIVEALREMAVAVYPDEYAAVASEITGNDDGV